MSVSFEAGAVSGRDLFSRPAKLLIGAFAVLCLVWVARAADKYLPAFSGAEGYGAFTPGGRGGKVLFVTTLEDYDSSRGETPILGSFRMAVETRGPRNILFRVSGTIFLKAELPVYEPYLTIAGQTAMLVTSAEYQAVTGGKSSHGRERDLPAEVDWPDAVRFCEALSRNTGRTFRLPTEAEWEYCCRAGTTTPFSTGPTISTDQANFDGKFVYAGGKPGIYRRGPTPVRTFAPNAWGLYDMHGNAFQWCSDWYGPYPESAVTDPQGPRNGADRVIRGGKYGSGPRYIRSASRYQYNPHNSSVVFGFRVVMEQESSQTTSSAH